MRRGSLLLLVLAGVATTLALGSGTARSTHAGLTPAERKALHIVSVTAAGEEPTGLVLTVTFAGDIEHALGRGNLRQAAVAMILVPRQAPLVSAGLITRGAGLTGQTLRHTRSAEVGVLRKGRRLVFFVHGPGAGQVDQIIVKTFAKLPGLPGARTPQSALAGEPIVLPTDAWKRAEESTAEDEAALKHFEGAHLGTAGCKDLESLRFQLRLIAAGAAGRAEAYRMDEQQLAAAIARLKRTHLLPAPAKEAAIAESVGAATAPKRADPQEEILWLEVIQRAVKESEARNDYLLIAARSMLRDVEAELARCSPGTTPPPPPTFAVAIDSSGYDHTTHGEPASRYPSTVCADFSTSPGQASATWQAVLTGPRSASVQGQLTGDGRGRIVFEIPQPGSYRLLVSVDTGSGPVTAAADISVPAPPPSGKSKDCSAPPTPV